MTNLVSELGTHSIDYNDHVSTIENEEERQDLMGDLPKWETMELNTFITEYYGKKFDKKRNIFSWYPIESKLGDGYWTGRNTIKEDVLTESVAQLTKRELTMFKFFSKEEVDELHKHISILLGAGDSVNNAVKAATSLIYDHARQTRWQDMRNTHSAAMVKLLNKMNLGYTPNAIFAKCKDMVAADATRDEFIASVKGMLGLEKLYGGPWKYLNSMYWNTKYWLNDEPSEVMLQCAKRYAHAINWDIQVNDQ